MKKCKSCKGKGYLVDRVLFKGMRMTCTRCKGKKSHP